MSVSTPQWGAKTSLEPANLQEIISVEARTPGFIERVDQAICMLYHIRGLRGLVAELPTKSQAVATATLNKIEEAASEPLTEWWCRTRAERFPKYPFDLETDCDPLAP
jgi:hypothetical protein